MSSLFNILGFQKSKLDQTSKSRTSLKLPASLEIALHYLNQYAEQQSGDDLEEENGLFQLVRFFIEQLQLSQVPKHSSRYSANTIKTAFLWQLTSSCLYYKKLQSFFVLLSLRQLQSLSGGATVLEVQLT